MPPATLPASTTITLDDLKRLGFDTARLQFYRWLVQHGQNPEWKGVRLSWAAWAETSK